MKKSLNKFNSIIVALALILFGSVFVSSSWAQLSEAEKIDRLIDSVRQLKGARLYRNGFYYSSFKAAEHLQQKRKNAGKSVKTAREFIEKIASKSSTSGKPYKIVFQNGREIFVQELLLQELEKIE